MVEANGNHNFIEEERGRMVAPEVMLQENIAQYSNEHDFHKQLTNMICDAFELMDPNPWQSIALKALILAGTNYDDFLQDGHGIINELERQNELLREKLNFYVREFGNYDLSHGSGNSTEERYISEEEIIHSVSSEEYSSPPHRPGTPIPPIIERNDDDDDIEVSPLSSPESISPVPQVIEQSEQPPLKLKFILRKAPDASVPSEDEKKCADIVTTEKKAPLILKFNLKEIEPPMTKIPSENLVNLINSDDHKELKPVQAPFKSDSKRLKLNEEENELKLIKQKRFNALALRRKTEPKQLTAVENNKQVEEQIEEPKLPNILKDSQEIKEMPFKLKIKLPAAFSEVTISNASVTTPTGNNMLLPPTISINSDRKSDGVNESVEELMEVDVDLTKENSMGVDNSVQSYHDIDDVMRSIHEEIPKQHHVEGTLCMDPPKDDNDATTSGDSLILTQNELREIEEISALKFSQSFSPTKSSDVADDDQKKGSSEQASDKLLITGSGKHLGMLAMQLSEGAATTDTDMDSSEEIDAKISDIDFKENAVLELVKVPPSNEAKSEVAPSKPILHTMASDDFEPDYEPDD